MLRIAALLLAFSIPAALAESNTLAGRPGFFKPTPDGNSSISRIVPPESVTAPAPEPAAPNPVTAAAEPATVAEAPAQRVREAEAEMDRAEREHRVMAERSAQAAPIAPGAYNGATSERDR